MAKAYEDHLPQIEWPTATRMKAAATFYEWARDHTTDADDLIIAAHDQKRGAIEAARARYAMGLRARDYDWESEA